MSEYQGGDLNDKNKDYWLALTQLRELLRQLSNQYSHQTKLIERKWSELSMFLISGTLSQNLTANLENTQMLLLHVSFETEIEGNVVESWDEGISGLQAKRYQI